MSLRARILLLVLAASLLPVLAMLWALLESRSNTIAMAQQQLGVRAHAIASELDDKIAGTAQLLFGLSRVPLIDSQDQTACSGFLAQVLSEHPQYTGLLTILPNGQLHCDSLRSGRRLDLTDRNYFQKAIKGRQHVVEPAIGRLTGKGVLQIAYPARDGKGALRHVLLASLNMEEYGRSVAHTLPYQNMSIQVWNADGEAVMNTSPTGGPARLMEAHDKAHLLSLPSGSTVTLGKGQEARTWVLVGLPRANAGVNVVLSVPETDLYAEVDSQFKRAILGLIALAVLSVLGAAMLGEFALQRQTGRIMDAITRLDQGDFKHPISAPYPRGELGEVMGLIDRMGGSLARQQEVIRLNTAALERQANFDALTGLANRHLLTDRLKQALIYAHRANRVAGVLVLDLDRFKTVNDSLGHSQGDVLLKVVAKRLTACVREGDTVARLGGDEFVVLLSDMAEVSDIIPLAQKILSSLLLTEKLEGQEVSASTSMGISVYPRDGESADVLLMHADTAMYRSKAQGGNTMAFFTPEMNQETQERLRIEAGLTKALENNELRVHFQPILDIQSQRIVSAEALVRWQHPERGLIPPAQFIAIAEETGLIVPMGHWVLRQACAQAKAWHDLGLGDVTVAVNLSARQFSSPSLETSVELALAETGCPAGLLQLEITESMLMEQADESLETMRQLRSIGVKLSIDDFGTGYSSLSYLKRFPVSKLKIDRSFVNDITVDSTDAAIVDTILSLALKLGLRTVAEGVETPEQLASLKQMGCTEYQGYLFSRPCPSEAFIQLLKDGQTFSPPS